jgi:hypothetical protein
MTAILKSEENAAKLETITIRQMMNMTVGEELSQNTEQMCQYSRPDNSTYCRTESTAEFGGQSQESANEIVQIGEQAWLREEGGEWQELPPDFIEQSGLSSEGLAQLRLSTFMTEANVTGQTMINNVPVYIVEFELDVAAYFGSILGEDSAEIFLESAEEMSGGGTIWIGQEDALPYKAEIHMTFQIQGSAMDVTTQVSYSGFNEPVNIPNPEEE